MSENNFPHLSSDVLKASDKVTNKNTSNNQKKIFNVVKNNNQYNNQGGNNQNYNQGNNHQHHSDRNDEHNNNNMNNTNINDDENNDEHNSYVRPKVSKEEREDSLQPIESFDELKDYGVNENIIRGIYGYGFEKPSPIQMRSIRPILTGIDIIAQAQSGMGKTGAFCIGVLGRIDENLNDVQAIILAHTRELALQINGVFKQIASYTNIRTSLCIKGIARKENVERLQGKGSGSKGKPHIIIGTPGRINDMLSTKDFSTGKYILNLSNMKCLVIDEADEMLGVTNKSYNRQNGGGHSNSNNNGGNDDNNESVGFLEQVKTILRCLTSNVQICLISATMNQEFFDLTTKFMVDPIEILIKTEQLTLDGIRQYLIDVEENKNKFNTLCALYSLLTINQSIIYCNSLKQVDFLTKRLNQNDFVVSFIHGKMTPLDREKAMMDFRNGKSRVLVSTDLLSRGIDVQQVSVVINYDIPNNIENYLHRIGRSGRYGRKGVAINFMTNDDKHKINEIQKYYSTMIEPLPEDINNLLD
jgi:superfamily II DNA/RNA helicase